MRWLLVIILLVSGAFDALAIPLGQNAPPTTWWETESPFINKMKGGLFTSYSYGAQTYTGTNPTFVDSLGYPTAYNVGNDPLHDRIWVHTMNDGSGRNWFHRPGDYVLSWTGQANVDLRYSGINWVSGDPEDVMVTDGRMIVNIPAIGAPGFDYQIGSPYPSKITLVPVGGICASDVFNSVDGAGDCSGDYLSFEDNWETILLDPIYLSWHKQWDTIRFGNWHAMNDADIENWADRSTIDHATWTSKSIDSHGLPGVPWEVSIQAVNSMGNNGYWMIPYKATNDYVTQMAALFHDTLDDDAKMYIEYSNEVWNGIFEQEQYAQAQGAAYTPTTYDPFSGSNPWLKARVWTGIHSAELMDIFSAEWAAPGPAPELIRVLGEQWAGGSTWFIDNVMSYDLAEDGSGTDPVYLHFDKVAIAPYISTGISGAPCPSVASMHSGLYSAIAGQAAGYTAQIDLITGFGGGGLFESTDLIWYEGGQHYAPGTEAERACNDRIEEALLDPEMENIFTAYLDGWEAAGGGLAIHFLGVGSWDLNRGNWWGMVSDYNATDPGESPRYDAFLAHNAAHSPPEAPPDPTMQGGSITGGSLSFLDWLLKGPLNFSLYSQEAQ